MARLHWVVALGSCLFAGCLFHRPGELPKVEPPAGERADATPPPDLRPPDPPAHSPALSDYNLFPLQPVVRQPAYFEPKLEPVKLEFGSGPALPPVPEKKEPAPQASPEPKRPAPEVPLVAALRCAMQKHPAEAQQLLSRYEKTDRELILALLRLAAGIDRKEMERLSPEELARTLEQLRVLTEQLRCHAALSLDRVCFCKRIDGFGQYDPLPDYPEFASGRDGLPGERVQVYVEVRNFSSLAQQERYETRLSSSLEILDEKGRPVASMVPETSVDVSQTPRQDYFLNFQFHVPAGLMPGTYTLRVTVRDVTPQEPKKAPRLARRSLDFRIGTPGARKR